MNYVALTGGLGNQMFIYAFKVFLNKKSKTLLFHPYCDHSPRYGNSGYQLEKFFAIKKESLYDKFVLSLLTCYWHFISIFPKKVRRLLLRLIGIKEKVVLDNFVFYEEVIKEEYSHTLFLGTWQSEKYFISAAEDIRKEFVFKVDSVNADTRSLLNKLPLLCTTVSIHIRRQDYLSPKYKSGFGGICTLDYYKNAVKFISNQINDPLFLVFSDDIEWCRKNLQLDNSMFIDWNTGDNSWQDMLLMSNCKHNIIANSSFSWWGAWLNPNPEKIIIAPRIWWNGLKDDIVPDEWVRL